MLGGGDERGFGSGEACGKVRVRVRKAYYLKS